jgi:protein-S-isoprenylcysteine O-methyltransferase Ste14
MTPADVFILATYAFQIIMVCFFPVPSAASTVEMLFKLGKDSQLSLNHPAKLAIQSAPRMLVLVAATIAVIIAALIPLLTIIFPPTVAYLFPFVKARPNILTTLSILLLIGGNVLTVVAVRTLRSHVTFHEFGEADSLHTAGIYGIIRNPITVGLAAIFTGFFLALPSVVMLLGFIVFLLNTAYRVGMEETYLERTFGKEYVRYKRQVGKYFPNLSNLWKR